MDLEQRDESGKMKADKLGFMDVEILVVLAISYGISNIVRNLA